MLFSYLWNANGWYEWNGESVKITCKYGIRACLRCILARTSSVCFPSSRSTHCSLCFFLFHSFRSFHIPVWLTISSFWTWLVLYASYCSCCNMFCATLCCYFAAVRNIKIWMHFLRWSWVYRIMLVQGWHKAGIKCRQNSKNYSWNLRRSSTQAEITGRTGNEIKNFTILNKNSILLE